MALDSRDSLLDMRPEYAHIMNNQGFTTLRYVSSASSIIASRLQSPRRSPWPPLSRSTLSSHVLTSPTFVCMWLALNYGAHLFPSVLDCQTLIGCLRFEQIWQLKFRKCHTTPPYSRLSIAGPELCGKIIEPGRILQFRLYKTLLAERDEREGKQGLARSREQRPLQ